MIQRVAATLTLTLALCASSASAQTSEVDAGVSAYEEGELDAALAAFDRAESDEGLTRDDVIRMLTYRALVEHGLRQRDAVDVTTLKLASLAPDDPFGRRAPPPVRHAYERALERTDGVVRVEAEVTEEAGGTRVVGRVAGDVAGLVTRVRVAARAGTGRFVESRGSSVTVPSATGSAVEYYVQAIGPGGAVLASAGSPDEPVSAASSGPAAATEAAGAGPSSDSLLTEEPRGEGGSDDGVWIGIGIALGVLAVAGGVIAAVLVIDAEQQSMAMNENAIAPPVVVFP